MQFVSNASHQIHVVDKASRLRICQTSGKKQTDKELVEAA